MVKNVLVTGGNSGIGFATARLFKAKGYNVSISGRDRERVQLAADELGVQGILADMANGADLEALVPHFMETGLDVLVNNAATAIFKPIEFHTSGDYDLFFKTNIQGPMELIRLLLPALEKRQGSVCNVSSIIVTSALPNASLYAATKGALDAVTRNLAVELAPRKVRVNAVAPGAIVTPILEKVGLTPEQVAGIRAQQEAMIPLHRYGTADEVAEVIVSQVAATYVTGAIWSVDGGVSL